MRNRGKQSSRTPFVRFRPGLGGYWARLRPLLALIGIFAIAIQSFVVQTHIHPQVAATFGLAQSDVAGVSATAIPGGDAYPVHGKFSTGDDASNCRLCQELIYAGRFVAPSAATLVMPVVFALLLVIFAHSTTVSQAGAYIWRSRAPPAHS